MRRARQTARGRAERAERGPRDPRRGGRRQDRAPAPRRQAGGGLSRRPARRGRGRDGAAVRGPAPALRADARPPRCDPAAPAGRDARGARPRGRRRRPTASSSPWLRSACCARWPRRGRCSASWTTPSGSTAPRARCSASWRGGCWRSRSAWSSRCASRAASASSRACRSLSSAASVTTTRAPCSTTVISGPIDEGVRDRIVLETRGNPLALLELPRGMSAADLAGGFALPDAGALPAHIEAQYVRRLAALPEATQRLMLLAAADPVGDATLVWRAAARARHRAGGGGAGGHRRAARDRLARALPASARAVGGVPQLGGVRPARRAPRARRRDRSRGRSRPPRLAPRARGGRARRGGGRRARCTARAARSGAAASPQQPRFWSGRWRSRPTRVSGRLVRSPPRGRSSRRGISRPPRGCSRPRARVRSTRSVAPRCEHVTAQIAFAMRRGRDAPPLLLRAAQRLEPLDSELAAETYLEALLAAIYAGRLAGARRPRRHRRRRPRRACRTESGAGGPAAPARPRHPADRRLRRGGARCSRRRCACISARSPGSTGCRWPT